MTQFEQVKRAHDQQLAKKEVEIVIYGWAQDRRGIITLTNMGHLRTLMSNAGRIRHEWNPGDTR